MRFPNDRHPYRGHYSDQRVEDHEVTDLAEPAGTGSEAAYLRSLIDSRTIVTVLLTTGERLRGRIRYYDRDCFSLGPTSRGPNLFLRKSSVHSIWED